MTHETKRGVPPKTEQSSFDSGHCFLALEFSTLEPAKRISKGNIYINTIDGFIVYTIQL